MRVGLDEIDGRISEAFTAYVGASLWAARPTPEQAKVRELLGKRTGKRVGLQLGLAFGAFPFIIAGAQVADANLPLAALLWIAGLSTSAFSVLAGRRSPDPVSQLRSWLTADEMQAVFSQLSLSRVEKLYCDTLVALAATDSPPEDGESEIRKLLPQVNALLAQSRALAERRDAVVAAMGGHSVDALEAEKETLSTRMADSADPAVRESLSAGARICDERLRNAQDIEAAIKRLDAQQEVIAQTLGSVHSSVTRRQTAPLGQSAPALSEMRETVSHINQETKSLEQAVEEVAALRTL